MNKKRKLQRVTLALSCFFLMIIFYFLFINKPVNIRKSNSDIRSYLIKPYFRGIDGGKNLYEINAKKAVQVANSTYDLTDIYFKYYLDDQKKSFFSAASIQGQMDKSTKIFQFLSEVEMIYSVGYRALTDKLSINFSEMTAYTDTKFVITGIRGKLTADKGLDYQIKKKKMYFKGPVRTLLMNQKL